MIKTLDVESSNYEVLDFSLRLLTSIYKTNKNIKDNLLILSIIYIVGVLVGVISDILFA